MINPKDITIGEIVTVLLEDDDGVEEETHAIVTDVFEAGLMVRYLTSTSKLYKNATVYELEEEENMACVQSLCEHHIGVKDLEEIGYAQLDDGPMYVLQDEINFDIESSSIEDMSDDEDEGTEDSFIVPDNVIDGKVVPPDDAAEIDAAWNAWQPTSSGAKKFKERVDVIEELARAHADNLNF
jgi:hypothetical protein